VLNSVHPTRVNQPPSTEIQISVALVTKNRPTSLERALRSWRGQTIQPSEIVLSDDSDDSVYSRIKQIAHKYDARWIPGPRRGLYANRNHIASFCAGTHILSGDDDHEHPSDFLEKCILALGQDPTSIWCLGEVHSRTDIDRGWLIPGELHLSGAPGPPIDAANTWAWSDGSTLCPRAVFTSGLRFSENFKFGASYLEFGCLLHYLGYKIRVLDNTGVIHHVTESGRSFDEPIEERAALYFALLMLGQVYQRTPKHLWQLNLYFMKQALRRPLSLAKALPAASRAVNRRVAWLRQWLSSNPEAIRQVTLGRLPKV
jgi:glycosyltransferase involved in cell wall biosynthesis